MPAELFSVKPDGSDLRQLTHLNDERRQAKIAWGDYEQFSFKGAKGDTVYGYVDEAGRLHAAARCRSRS